MIRVVGQHKEVRAPRRAGHHTQHRPNPARLLLPQRGVMIYGANAIVEGHGHDDAVQRIFFCDDLAYVNARTTKAGCMLCHIERA
jgi:hypothetical protein